jgi:hypothetical protein
VSWRGVRAFSPLHIGCRCGLAMVCNGLTPAAAVTNTVTSAECAFCRCASAEDQDMHACMHEVCVHLNRFACILRAYAAAVQACRCCSAV